MSERTGARAIDGNARNHLAGVIGGKREPGHLADLEAVEENRRTGSQSGDRAVEADPIGRALGQPAGVVEPVDEADDADGDGQHEQADEEVAGADFHGFSSVYWLAVDAPVGARAPTAEIGSDPRMLGGSDRLHRSLSHDLAVGQRRNAVAGGIQAVEVVGDHEYGDAERMLQRADEHVEGARRDRVEARGRLVEEHNLWIERQRAGEPDTFGHAAGQLGRELVGILRTETDELQLHHGQVVHQVLGQVEELAHGELDIFLAP